ncbi:probable LRR receptor-like serine/threonine-protein kinase At3g47570 [Magnolia sinica]|uniref:probable LRR receptor-like serine/threonine-protein kinase At3g47570 n=1 Tax=Magnolia sinica TaxID=86752 RepID=UPI002658A8FA|nr:probable LRR receptor-like serine/threonine-protein kinase At3g47570 [Magnolia sinica]
MDPHSIKHLLDESVSEIVTGWGYTEDVRLRNIRLLVGTVIITIALVAQFYRKKFPENKDFLIGCIALYPSKPNSCSKLPVVKAPIVHALVNAIGLKFTKSKARRVIGINQEDGCSVQIRERLIQEIHKFWLTYTLDVQANTTLQNLRRNKFSGKIPSSIGNITRLSILLLDGNDFHGSIPSSFGNWGFLEQLFIPQNKFNGTILKQVGAVKINMSGNSFTGSLLLEVDNLENIREMDASENKLSGEIPDTLGKCQSMELLYIHGNLFQGTIPESLKNLKGIKELDFLRNNLSGQIPKYFEEFHFLLYLNLLFNNFAGEVPKRRNL